MEPSLETQQQYHYNTAAECRYSSGRARGEDGDGGGEKVGRGVGQVWDLLILVAVPDGAQPPLPPPPSTKRKGRPTVSPSSSVKLELSERTKLRRGPRLGAVHCE